MGCPATAENGRDPVDVSRSAHNPEVAGSNPAPATNVVAGQRPFPIGRGPLACVALTRSVTRLLTSDISVAPLRLRWNAELRFVAWVRWRLLMVSGPFVRGGMRLR